MTAPALDTAGMADARAIYAGARSCYTPKASVPIVPWVERYFYITKDSGAALPGPYRFTPVPWWREVAEALADDVTEQIVVAKSSQVGYTELLLAFVGWCMDQDPSSMLMIQPNVEMAEDWSKARLAPAIRESPALQGMLRSETRGMARSSDDTLRRKAFPGGYLAMIGANSPAGLASRAVRRVLADELDRWDADAGGEGSPLDLARRRAITFWNRKIVAGGTPVHEGGSATWSLWEQSDQRHWLVPCPHCGERQALRWRDESGAYHIVCDRDEDGRLRYDTAAYRCAHCACLIAESDKAAMVAAGSWVATHPGRKLRGYHIWAAYSSFMSWGEIVEEFDKARGAENELKTFVNTILGQPFAPAAEKIDPATLMARAEPMPVVPPEVGLLTAGVDVQGDRLEYVVWGWGEGERGVVLEYDQVNGDPGEPATWAALTEALARPRGDLRIAAAAVDTGYRPETAWKWAEGRLPFRVFPVKGQDGRGRLIMQKPGAVTRKRQRRPWLVGVDTAKDTLAARLRSAPEGAQGVRFADSLPAEFYDHLTAERLVTKYVGTRPTRKWELIPGRRNEGLDCSIYALAALHGLGVAVIQQLAAYAERRKPKAPAPEAPPPAPESRAEAMRRARTAGPPKRSWTNAWR